MMFIDVFARVWRDRSVADYELHTLATKVRFLFPLCILDVVCFVKGNSTMNLNDSRHLRIVTLLAKVAETVIPVRNARIAAAIVYKNDIIALGTNTLKSDPMAQKYSYLTNHQEDSPAIYLHAEISAIKRSLRYLNDLSHCSLYIVRVKFQNDRKFPYFGLSLPCVGCFRAIREFGLRNIVYTEESSFFFPRIAKI